MKTRIYVDGYNFYYGLLERTDFKWLNIYSLLQSITKPVEPSSKIDKLYFFTSAVRARLASRGQQSVASQEAYLKALIATNSDVNVIMGYHDIRKKKAPLFNSQKPIDRSESVNIWHIEEKKTDVNIGVHVIRDVLAHNVEQVIIVSNDTDLLPAIEIAKAEIPSLTVGVIFPISQKSGRQVNTELKDASSWSRTYIKSEELEEHQLVNAIPKPNGRGVYRKPNYW